MSRLDELIQQYCPDGVEYVKIGEIVNYEQPGKYIVRSTDYNDSFPFPVLTAGQSFILGYTDEEDGHYIASPENPVIIFDDFTGAFKWVDFEFKVKSSAMKMLTADTAKTSTRYVFHLMGKLNFTSSEHKRLWIGTYSEFLVPLPPLPVQEEIVRILDSFTQLTAELQAELQARKKQYEYYKHHLLTDGENIVELGDVAYYAKGRISASLLDETNYVGVDNLLQNCAGRVDSTHVPSEGNLIEYKPNDIMIGNIRPYLRKIWFANNTGGTNGDVLTIRLKDKAEIEPKYLYYVLSSDDFFVYDTNNAKGAKMPRGDKDAVMRYQFSAPSIDVQRKVISILDRFDILCYDISAGLPAEIESRQKQYEYYRDNLLTFQELS